jgi:hypothetical protein
MMMDVANQAHSVKHLRSTGQARANGSVPIAIKPMAVTGWATGSYIERLSIYSTAKISAVSIRAKRVVEERTIYCARCCRWPKFG